MFASPFRADAAFTAWLSELPPEALAALISARPDTVRPTEPPTIASLATRLRTRASIARALSRMTALDLALIEIAAECGACDHPVEPHELSGTLRERAGAQAPAEGSISESIERLIAVGVLFPIPTTGKADKNLALVPEVLAALPRDWAILPDLAASIADLPEASRTILLRLARGGGVGHSRDAQADADPTRPIPQLLAAGLIERLDATHVRLARGVGRMVLGTQPPWPLCAPGQTAASGAPISSRRDAAAVAQAIECTERITRLLDELGRNPIPLTRNGTVGLPASRQLAKRLRLSAAELAFYADLARAAGLLSTGLARHIPDALAQDANYLAPSLATDVWLGASPAERWARLAAGWWQDTRRPWRAERLLDEGTASAQLVETRRAVLRCVARAGTLSTEDLSAYLAFYYPVLTESAPAEDLAAILDGARVLGILTTEASTPVTYSATVFTTPLLSDDHEALLTAFADHAPAKVDRVILQADLTVTAPGPLPSALRTELESFADLESPGLAAVYRLSPESIRRGLDTGYTAGQLRGWLADHALGEVPQAIGFLIDDAARRHGSLRGGAVSSYLRCEDPAVIEALLHCPGADEAGLIRLAPTAVVSALPLVRLMDIARAGGLNPVAEDASGAMIDVRPEPTRVVGRQREPRLGTNTIDAAKAQAIADRLTRAAGGTASGNAKARSGRTVQPEQAALPHSTERDVLTPLTLAIRAGATVTIDFVDRTGESWRSSLTPLRIDAGQVDAIDPLTGQVTRIALHRIAAVTIV